MMNTLLKCLAYTLNGVEWEGEQPDFASLFKVAQQQSVSSFLVDAPPCVLDKFKRKDKVQLITLSCALQSLHEKTNAFLVEMAKWLAEANINYCLLKGQTCAICYPIPERRAIGDIDLYIAPEHFDSAKELFGHKGFKEMGNTWQHCILQNSEGFIVELHHTLQRMQWPAHNFAIEKYCKECCFNKYIVIHNQKICVLPPELDMVMLTLHLLTHLMGEGVGLRHICDWMMRIKHSYKKNEDVNKDKLQAMLLRLHLKRLWQVLSYIAVSYLGLPMKYLIFPCDFSKKNEELAHKVLNRIFQIGAFGVNIDMQKRSNRIMGRYSLFLSNSVRFYNLVPHEALATPFVKGIEGMQQRFHNSKHK